MGKPFVDEWRSPDGAHYAFDGAFYSFAHPDGQGIKLWVPPGDDPVRGVILFGNPGGGLGGDTRTKSRQRGVVEFAARHRFGVAGVTGFPGRDTYATLGQIVVNAFQAWGRHGVHPELEAVPFLFSGSSNAGVFAFAMMMRVPQRTIGITSNVGPFYRGNIDDAVRKVPAWLHVGTCDPLFPAGVEDTEALFAEHGPRGALWTWEAEIKGHADGSSDHVDFAFWDALIALRLPATVHAVDRRSPVALVDLDPAAGWWTDFRTWDHTIAKVLPASEPKPFPAERSRYGWVPTEGIARLYQAAASRTRVMCLSLVQDRESAGQPAAGKIVRSGGIALVNPGDVISLQITLAPLQWPLEVIEFYDRDEKLGQIDGRETLQFSFRADERPVYAIYARARARRFAGDAPCERVSNPLQIVVRAPQRSAQIESQWAGVDWLSRHKAAALDADAFDRIRGETDPAAADTLHAAALDGAQAAGLRADGARSPLWETVARRAAPVVIDRASETAAQDGDIGVCASAAYSDEGLFLRFRIKDAPAAPGQPAPVGRLDFHLASVGLPRLRATQGSLDTFATPALNALLRNALQFAFSPAEHSEAAPDVSVNRWDPWDAVATRLSAADDYGGTGLRLDRAPGADGTCAVAVFLPWSMVGNPGWRLKPPAGSSFATVLGYDAAGRPNKHRWPHAKDPWLSDPRSNPASAVFGQIVLDP